MIQMHRKKDRANLNEAEGSTRRALAKWLRLWPGKVVLYNPRSVFYTMPLGILSVGSDRCGAVLPAQRQAATRLHLVSGVPFSLRVLRRPVRLSAAVGGAEPGADGPGDRSALAAVRFHRPLVPGRDVLHARASGGAHRGGIPAAKTADQPHRRIRAGILPNRCYHRKPVPTPVRLYDLGCLVGLVHLRWLPVLSN
jgi:hypothetical protein